MAKHHLAAAGLISRSPLPRVRRWAASHSATLWTLTVISLVAVFIVRERAAVGRAAWLVQQSLGPWFALALALGVVMLLDAALTYRLLLARLGHPLGWRATGRAYTEGVLAGAISPISTPAAAYGFARVLGQYGVPVDDALLAFALNNGLGLVSFLAFIVLVLIVLELQHQVTPLLLVWAFLLAALVVLMSTLFWLLLRGAALPGRLQGYLPHRLRSFAERARRHGLRPNDFVLPFLLALGIDVLGAAVLYASLRAAGAHPSLATALVADSIGTLAVILAPGFSGTGPVELGTAATLATFGLPHETAVAATLLARLVTLWLPAAVGLLSHLSDRSLTHRAAYRIPAVFTGLTGLLAVVSLLLPRGQHRFNRIEPFWLFSIPAFSRTFTLLAGFFLLFLAYNLWRRKRVAWMVAVVLLASLVVAHLLKRHDEIFSAVTAVNLAILLWQRRWFTVRQDTPTLRQGLLRFGLSLLFALIYGTVGFYLSEERAFGHEFDARAAVTVTLRTFFNLGESGLIPQTRHARWFLDSLQVLGAVSMTYAVLSLARPVVWRRTTHQRERERARALVTTYGDSSLDYFKHAEDKLFFFASNGRGVASFGLANGVAVVLGDPVAASDDDFALTLREFLDLCETNDWEPAFLQATPKRLEAYRAAGLSAAKIGEEASVDLDRFTLQGGAMKDVRYLVRRLEREGYRVVFSAPPQPDDMIQRLRAVSDEWLSIGGHRERRFTLGRFEDDYIRASPIFAVESPEGEIVAFANLIPDGKQGEATIDLMRRRREPSGVMEYLFVKMFQSLKEQGFHAFSLGMAPLANVGVDPDAPFVERMLRQAYEHLNMLFSYKGLRSFKDKFKPDWEPRYLIYRSELALPKVALAIVRLTE